MGNSNSVNTSLLEAVKKGEIDKVKQLCKDSNTASSLDINYKDSSQATLLMWACSMGHIKIIEFLISKGARLTDCDKDGYTPLHYAVTQKQENVVKLLVTNTKYLNTLNINAKNNLGDTALHRSIYYSLKEISSLLIVNGNADINATNNLNETPLDKARKSEIKQWLKSMGGKNNVKKSEIEGGIDDHKENKNDVNISSKDKQYLLIKEKKQKVIEWIETELSLPYKDNFIDNGYDSFDAILNGIKEKSDLEEIKITKIGHIKMILNSINEYRENQENIKQIEKLNQPGMNMNDINHDDENAENDGNIDGDNNDDNDNNENVEMDGE